MLRLQDLVFDAYGRRFFDSASAALPVGAKVGLVGRNGAGKTTLFRIIQGELTAGSGEIILAEDRPYRHGRPGTGRDPGPSDRHQCSPPTSSARCADRQSWRPRRPSGSPTSTSASPRSAPTRSRRRPPRSWSASASRKATSHAPWPSSPAAGGCAPRWRRRCSRSRSCCCSMSRPTSSTWKVRPGWRSGRLKRAPVDRAGHQPRPRSCRLDRAMDFILHLDQQKPTLYFSGRLHRLRAPARGAARAAGLRCGSRWKPGAPICSRSSTALRAGTRARQGAVAAEDDPAAGRHSAGRRGPDRAVPAAVAGKAAAAAAAAAGGALARWATAGSRCWSG